MKTAIIGLGNVGSTLAYTLSIKGLAKELVLINKDRDKAEGDAQDLLHSLVFTEHTMDIKAGELADLIGADLVILTLSVPYQHSFTSRFDLAPGNIELFRKIVPEIADVAPDAVIMVISNPVDLMTYVTWKISGFSSNKVFGVGTLIDSARFREYLSLQKGIHPDDIRAYILGEHGDSQLPAWSIAYTGGEKIDEEAISIEAFNQTFKSGYDIVKGKGYTNFGISMAAALIVESMYLNNCRTIPVSTLIVDYLGISDVCLSVPAVIGRAGISRTLKPDLNQKDAAAFRNSASVVKAQLEKYFQ
jgi:L-lactate dehydrogenase